MLEAGFPLSEVTEALCRRWLSTVHGGRVRLLPMSDDRVETHIAIADADSPSGRSVIHFQEYWVRLRAEVPAEAVLVVGLETSTPAPGVLEAIATADLVVLPPSNPVVSVGTILGVPGIRDAVRTTDAPVVGLSPIVGGSHVRGMAAPAPDRDRRRGQRRRGRSPLRLPGPPAASSTAGWSTPPTPTRSPPSRPPASGPAPSR